jgi:Dihydrodipicolinate synthetase family
MSGVPGGVVVPLVTPFLGADEEIDHAALRGLVAHFIEQDVDGLMPTAVTGEGPLLTPRETLDVWGDGLRSEWRALTGSPGDHLDPHQDGSRARPRGRAAGRDGRVGCANSP